MDPALTTPTARSFFSNPLWKIWLPRVGIILLLIVIGLYAGRRGLQFRRWMWETTAPIRFVPDIDRAYGWGRTAATEGYLNQYDKMQTQQPSDSNWLDLAPLHLAVMTEWGKWSMNHFPKVETWEQNQTYEFTEPVLRFTLFLEIIGLVSAFFLIRLWSIRSDPPSTNDPTTLRYFFRGCIPAFFGVLLLWFNPALVLAAYGWASWELWIVPLFLLAALLASLDWWFTAGVVIGIGAMFNGHQLLAVPLFIIWSLFFLRPLFTLRFISGTVIAVAIITSGWLLTYIPADQLAKARDIQATFPHASDVTFNTFKLARTLDIPALMWVIGVTIASAGLPWVGWLTLKKPDAENPKIWHNAMASPWAWRGIAAFTAFALVVWPWLIKSNRPDWAIGVSSALILACAVLLVRPRGIAIVTAAATGTALLLCMSAFHGSSAWYDCGLHFESIHFPTLISGPGEEKTSFTDNLPAILNGDFKWEMNDFTITFITMPAHWIWHYPAKPIDWSIKEFLVDLFRLTTLLCCLGAGMHARRQDARVLIALTAPWLMLFCFAPQMQSRDLLFTAGICCICTGASLGMTLLGILLSLITFVMIFSAMLDYASYTARNKFGEILSQQFPKWFSDEIADKLKKAVEHTHPDLGYAVVLCGLIFLYYSIAPRWRDSNPAIPKV